MGEFTMPTLGADMEEGTLLEWLVAPGAQVHRGDVVAVVDTDKSAVDVEVFEDGVMSRLLVEPGTRVPVGTPLAEITSQGGPAAAAEPVVVAPGPPAVPPVPAQPAPVAAAATPTASPVVRRLAHRLGVDLAQVRGTGAGGRVTHADVEAAAHARAAVPAIPASVGARVRSSPRARALAAQRGIDLAAVAGTGPDGAVRAVDLPLAPSPPAGPQTRPAAASPVPVPRPAVPPVAAGGDEQHRAARRQATARLMARANREIPQYAVQTTLDVEPVLAELGRRNTGRAPGERLVLAAALARATALAARRRPSLNGTWEDGDLRPAASVHLGVSVALRGGGLVTPVLRDAQNLDLDATMAALRGAVERVRRGRTRQGELEGGTITLTNLGERGAESVHGVIFPPQVALVGVGRPVQRPWAVDGLLGVRKVVTVVLTGDHRASDGHEGSLFLADLEAFLAHPDDL
jgi:pyruvate dehydrogenase E2 component (dihydrolipoamide acetyltransferase)